ncbi:MAG: hypothetical protein ACTHOE_10130 [Conexibacter sp.]
MGAKRRGSRLAQALAGAIVVLAAAPALAQAAARADAHHEAAEAGRWSLLFAFVGLLVVAPLLMALVELVVRPQAVGNALPWRILRGIVVGADNRVSTSKTVAAVWTYSVAAALLSFVIAKWMGHGLALVSQEDKGLQSNYGLLLSAPLGAAIIAKGIVGSQTAGNAADEAGSKAGGTPAASQLIANDQGDTDLGDLQYVLFNLVALVFFYGELLRAPWAGMPNLPDLLVGLTSVSAVGYLGKKVIPPTTLAITRVTPESASGGDSIEIAGPGLASEGEPPRSVQLGDRVLPANVVHTPAGPVTRVQIPADMGSGKFALRVTTFGGVEVTWDRLFVVASR